MRETIIQVEKLQNKCEELTGLLDAMYYAVSNGDRFEYRTAAFAHLLDMGMDIISSVKDIKEKLV
ncbi:hypothetical protein [Leptotrichia hofstadii]|jgi:hypothetical protein|uniref:Uncharacterized protein n=1 Tax=Leptotrichia hofstadii F0254 TaxID=634994 RepID=C9MX28_9FUSO|nr:hypothetical protein [Leptotrichia hofstadii]EEX75044.1 hypothetical protein GCWU000323_01099 [Leptotrichia hofstadii F0254]